MLNNERGSTCISKGNKDFLSDLIKILSEMNFQ